MTREERFNLAIERGYTYNPETGIIYNRYGKISKRICQGYYMIGIVLNKKTYNLKAHHFAWYCVYGYCDIKEIDHINGIKNDNRICNLRSITHQQNQFNITSAKGYSWNKNLKKWMARITVNGKDIYLGYYNTTEEARNAYLEAKEKYHIL
jgi:hypothetical protein